MLLKWMGDARLREAEYCVAIHVDPTTAIVAARGYLDRADLARPRNMTTWWLRARAARFAVKSLLSRHQDAAAEIAVGQAANARVLELAPSAIAGWIERAELELAIGDLESARRDATKAVTLDANDENANLVGADIELALASRSRDRASIARGLTLIERALVVGPRSPRARSIRAALLALQHA